MKAESLLEAMGFVDGDLVLQAHEEGGPRRGKSRNRRRWLIGGLAACLATALVIPAVIVMNGVLPRGEISSDTGLGSDPSVSYGAVEKPERDYRIYYVDGSSLGCISVRLKAAPQERFNAWKDANHIGDEVEFIDETTQNDSYRLTVSDSLRAYYDEENDLLQQSLGKTMAETGEEPYGGFELYLGEDTPDLDYANKYDEQGRFVSGIVHYDDGSTSTSYFDYDAGTYTLTRYYPGGGLDWMDIYEIDSTGELTGPFTAYFYGAGGVVTRIDEYDENQICRHSTYYYDDGSLESVSESDENGREISVIRYHEDGSVDYRFEAEYVEDGREARHTYYDGEDKVKRTEYFAFDENSNLMSWQVCDGDGQLSYFFLYTYDENGNRITAEEYRPDGTLKHLTEFTYNGGSFYSSRSEYEYDEEGNLISEWHGGELDGIIAGITGDE